jgi:hypothetical protein|tara:strand:+ start:69 stop:239 length:171 start_codon:yes stop_codon:yes gene_type:complete
MVMAKKTCDSFFCTNKTPKKYRYCYDCARSKGLVGNNGLGIVGWFVIIVIVLAVFG